MDRLIYTALSGARTLMDQQSIVSNNIANLNTNGFRADLAVFQTVDVPGKGNPTRAGVSQAMPAVNFTSGAIMETGRALDVAVQGDGWIAVQAADGSEAYTRGGGLEVSAEGVLQTHAGLPVIGDGGPIAVPPDTTLSIARDGTVSAVPTQPPLKAITTLGRIKLVNPPESNLAKGVDGLFRLKDGSTAAQDEKVALTSGALEGSNVNAAEAMVSMIDLARQFDMQMKLMQSAQDDAQRANQLLSISS